MDAAGLSLVTLDLDGTLLETTVFQAAADGLGFGEEVRWYDAHFFRGTLSLEATFLVEYDLFLGYEVAQVHQALEQGPWLAGIQETVDALREAGLEVWVVTDQPSWAVGYLARWGITDGVYTRCATRGGRIGAVLDQVFEKWPALEHKLAQQGIRAQEVCHVGNGSNDVPIFEKVGRSVAVNPSSPEVSQAADATVKGKDLRDVLEHVL